MKYINLFIIMGTLYMAYLVARSISREKRQSAQNKKNYMDRESKANSVRRADISNLPYIKIPFDSLPFKEIQQFGLTKEITKIESLADKRILNLSMYSNTDLKLMYGPANLEELSLCDSNFTELIRTLNSIAATLIENGQRDYAKIFLEYSISIGSDISSTYANLATIYKENGEDSKLDELIDSANHITSLSKSTIITKLNNIKSQEK